METDTFRAMLATVTERATGFDRDAFEAFLQRRGEPAWLADFRRAAFDTFASLDLPSRKHEEWMRTDIRRFHLERYTPLPGGDQAAHGALPAARLAAGVQVGGSVLSLDGQCVTSALDEDLAAQGVLCGPIADLAGPHEDLLRPRLMTRAFDPAYDKFAALHAAFFGGAVIYVPPGVEIKKPLLIQNVLGEGGFDAGHQLIILGEGAAATVLSETASLTPGGDGFHCGGVELLVGKRARLRYVNLQNWGSGVWHFAHQKARLAEDAALQWTLGALGARLAKVNQQVALVGPGARSQVNGAMFTEGTQHLAYHTLQHHEAPNTRSDFLYKAALQDKSRTVWRGMIKVEPAAQRTDGYQRNDNLLLTPDARADSIPGLEIQADDVRCTHGATTGRVDDELIFYCQSRGFTRREAVRAIVTGFFQQIFDRITIESVREALGLAIAQRVREYE